jgi:glycosyltransferase involved in cell wall biosynthesis
MRLLIYSHFFPPNIGGVETFVRTLANGLAGMCANDGGTSFEVTVVTQTVANGYIDAAWPSFAVVRGASPLDLWRRIRGCDAVHVAGTALLPIILGLLAGKPVVVEHHGFQAICPNGQLLIEPAGVPCPGHFMAGRHGECLRCNVGAGWIKSLRLWGLTFVRRFVCARVAANITPTEWLGELLELPRVTAIAHGIVNLERTTVEAKATCDGVSVRDLPVIAFVGRLVTTKGVGLLMEAARILRHDGVAFRLLIIGDGPERGALEATARNGELSEVVRFAGRLNAEELEAALRGASMVAVPSLGGEVFGLVVAENMLRGLPVVASDLGAFVEVLGDGGLTFATGDARGLAAQLARLLGDAELRTKLGAEGRKRAAEFCDVQRMLEAHARIYLRLGAEEASRIG